MNCSWWWANGARVSPPQADGIVSPHSLGASAYQPRRTRRVSFCGVSGHTFPSHPHPVGFVQWRTSGPSHRATCTYCWSHALTPPNWISRSHKLCSTVESAGPCSFVMKVLSLFLSSFFFQLLLIGRYFSDESIYILCVCVLFLSSWRLAEYANIVRTLKGVTAFPHLSAWSMKDYLYRLPHFVTLSNCMEWPLFIDLFFLYIVFSVMFCFAFLMNARHSHPMSFFKKKKITSANVHNNHRYIQKYTCCCQ